MHPPAGETKPDRFVDDGAGKQKAAPVVAVAVAAEKNENFGEDEVAAADNDNAATAAAAAGAAPAETASSDKNSGIDMPGAAGADSDTAGPREDLLRRFLPPMKLALLSVPGGDGGRERGRMRPAVRGCGRAAEPAARGQQGPVPAGVAPTDTDGISSLRGLIIPLTTVGGGSLRSQGGMAQAGLGQRGQCLLSGSLYTKRPFGPDRLSLRRKKKNGKKGVLGDIGVFSILRSRSPRTEFNWR